MTYRIHFEWPDGTEDSVVVSGDTIEDIRERANVEIARRGGKNPWSENLDAGEDGQ